MPAKPAAIALAAVVVLISALPATASQAPPNAQPVTTAGYATTANCTPPIPFLPGDVATTPPAATPAPAWLEHPTQFRGFCPCGCSPIRDCNTSADCGGLPCRPAISCC